MNLLKNFFYFLIIFIFLLSTLNNNSVNNDLIVYPVDNYSQISSKYGNRVVFGKPNFHNGIDFPVKENTKVYSMSNGIVKFAGFNKSGYGNCIIVYHENGYSSLYGHLSDNFKVTIGDNVKCGELIGFVGPKILSNGITNGFTTGVHLHFSIFSKDGKSIDPLLLNYTKKQEAF